MKALKVLAVTAVFGCYVFGIAGASAQQICPVGGGACVSNPTPASSYSNARAVDVTPRLPVVDPLGPAGSYCGWYFSDSSTEGGSTQSIPCQGRLDWTCPAGYQMVPLGVSGSQAWASCIKL